MTLRAERTCRALAGARVPVVVTRGGGGGAGVSTCADVIAAAALFGLVRAGVAQDGVGAVTHSNVLLTTSDMQTSARRFNEGLRPT